MDITVAAGDGTVAFRVADDGVGFEAQSGTEGRCFADMRDRVGAFGGRISTVAPPGRRCTVEG